MDCSTGNEVVQVILNGKGVEVTRRKIKFLKTKSFFWCGKN